MTPLEEMEFIQRIMNVGSNCILKNSFAIYAVYIISNFFATEPKNPPVCC